jgi:UPF0716 protein FxsA
MKLFVIFLLCLPFIEVYFFVSSIDLIGPWYSFLLSLLNICLGFYLFKLTGFIVLKNVQAQIAQAKLPTIHILKGMVRFVAAILLIIPGFFTDLIALLLLIPGLSHIFLFAIARNIDQAIKRGAIKVYHNFEQRDFRRRQSPSGEIIEVEFSEAHNKPNQNLDQN